MRNILFARQNIKEESIEVQTTPVILDIVSCDNPLGQLSRLAKLKLTASLTALGIKNEGDQDVLRDGCMNR